MNDDYLWDKSGQPDPQVQQLEEILGTLRYQPKPLVLPKNLMVTRRRNYFPLLAIAASLLIAVLATGVWLLMRKGTKSEQARVQPSPTVEEKVTPRESIPLVPDKPAPREEERIAINPKRRSKPRALKNREREEALAAKEQVLLALRLASEKLNLAHKKTQGTTPATQLKNQHRTG